MIIDAKRLKLIAVFTMAIDHLAAAIVFLLAKSNHELIPAYKIMRGIGRIAFPIYGFLLVEGFFYTRNRLKYLRNLCVLALVSEIPFDLALSRGEFADPGHQNVFFTLAISLCLMMVLDMIMKKLPEGDMERYDLMGLSIALASLGAYLLKCDYKHGGVLMITSMYLVRVFLDGVLDRPTVYRLMMFAGCVAIWIYSDSEIYAFLNLIPVAFYNGKRGEIKHKYLYYFFYPLHLLIYGVAVLYLKNI